MSVYWPNLGCNREIGMKAVFTAQPLARLRLQFRVTAPERGQYHILQDPMTLNFQTNQQTLDYLVSIANRFQPQGQVQTIRAYGSGNINGTFLVTLDTKVEPQFILQRINTKVFQQPELVMQNISTLTEHVCQRLQKAVTSGVNWSAVPGDRPWQVPRVLLTQEAQDHWIEPDGSFWRAMSFITLAQSFDQIQDLNHAQEIGSALGTFHALLSDLPPEQLAYTLDGFHITPQYLAHYDQVRQASSLPSSPEVDYSVQFICDRRHQADVLERAKAQGQLCLRPTHGDPKINNVMICTTTGCAISMIDLDTVQPGLIHYDIGDCLRSACNPLGEETSEWEAVTFDLNLCRALLQGYLAVAQEFLTDADYDYLYEAIRLLPFELGLRFFTDYLEGNIYFRTAYPEHNLARALVQFKLAEQIEAQEVAIQALIQDLR